MWKSWGPVDKCKRRVPAGPAGHRTGQSSAKESGDTGNPKIGVFWPRARIVEVRNIAIRSSETSSSLRKQTSPCQWKKSGLIVLGGEIKMPGLGSFAHRPQHAVAISKINQILKKTFTIVLNHK